MIPSFPSQLVPLRDLGSAVRRLRQRRGLTTDDVAGQLGLDPDIVERAEGSRCGPMYRTRKLILERLTGYTIEGPYYKIRPLPEDE